MPSAESYKGDLWLWLVSLKPMSQLPPSQARTLPCTIPRAKRIPSTLPCTHSCANIFWPHDTNRCEGCINLRQCACHNPFLYCQSTTLRKRDRKTGYPISGKIYSIKEMRQQVKGANSAELDPYSARPLSYFRDEEPFFEVFCPPTELLVFFLDLVLSRDLDLDLDLVLSLEPARLVAPWLPRLLRPPVLRYCC